ncbi:centrosomal protein of 72 kDa isoform X1 [Toxotes jaculatrix]|uniref:centrosomal protein of 72 kDa isoform X1 n=1 Tax=Toxotes jaculatrix TaxID=941984 RepID=UPI001B3B035E|nr:centrosomal protein of 72 kDa isoform X1 [Toxotes jaculatrix]
MAAECLTTITEQWIRDRLQLKHPCLGDVRSLSLPGTYEEKIRHLGNALNNFVRLKSLDLSCNALVSIEGVQHLKKLERLILYYNCIPSLEEVKVVYELSALRELDLRLNPLTKSYPNYRLYLVQAMPNLRKLDSCPVRDTERKATIMQFSSDLLPQQKSSCLNRGGDQNSDQRLALVDRLTKRLSLLTDTDDVVLNFVAMNHEGQSETISDSVHNETGEPRKEESQDFTEQRSSTPKQETAKSILRNPPSKYDNTESKVPHMKDSSHKKGSTKLKLNERPKVSFGPYVEERRPVPGKQKDFPKHARHAAKGHFTPNPDQSRCQSSSFINIRPPSPHRPGLNLSDPTNPTLHPPRLTYSSFNKTEGGTSLLQQAEKKKRGSYRKPLEMLLNLVDKHWTGERSLHHNNNFLSQAVQILSMMENDISSREAEVRNLRREADALSFQAAAREEEHKTEVGNLSAQLEETRSAVGKLNEQLRIVLEENVALQKQLIKLERQYLKSMMKSSPITQIKEAQTEVEELRKEIEGLREKVQEAEKVKELSNMLQESHRSLVATNECLLAELKGSGEH